MGISWIDHRWGGTLCLCDGSSWLWSAGTHHHGCLRFPSGEYQPSQIAYPRHPRCDGQFFGCPWGGWAIPTGLGSIGYCTLGHILWLLWWCPVCWWIAGHAGCFDVWGYVGTLWGTGSSWDDQLKPFLYQVYIEWCSHTFACGVACTVDEVGLHVWAFAGWFLGEFVVILYDYMPALEVCVEHLKAKAQWQTLSLNACIVSLHISKNFTGKGDRLAAL